jgi:hypothetical protein
LHFTEDVDRSVVRRDDDAGSAVAAGLTAVYMSVADDDVRTRLIACREGADVERAGMDVAIFVQGIGALRHVQDVTDIHRQIVERVERDKRGYANDPERCPFGDVQIRR